jgi:hypothetical protein
MRPSSQTSLLQALDDESDRLRGMAGRPTADFYIALLQCGETVFGALNWTFSPRCR